MHSTILSTLLLCASLLGAAQSAAAVVMCTDPVTGEKTFTDKACPNAGSGKKVKVDATNFGDGVHRAKRYGTWKSDIDTSVSGRDNLDKNGKHAQPPSSAGIRSSDS